MMDPETQASEEYHQSRWVDWNTLSPKERQKKINRSRNYIRYKLCKNLLIDLSSPLLTPEEKLLIEKINDNFQAIRSMKMALFNAFYDNCPKVGSTLKRKEKKPKEPLEDLIGKI